jgi:hypothetical protein
MDVRDTFKPACANGINSFRVFNEGTATGEQFLSRDHMQTPFCAGAPVKHIVRSQSGIARSLLHHSAAVGVAAEALR